VTRAPAAVLGACAVLLAAGCFGGDDDDPGRAPSATAEPAPSFRGAPERVRGLRTPARATRSAVQLATRDGFRDRFWAGVNLGSTTPGHLPGEVSARAADYRRWFPEMAALGVRVVRVYTLLDPSFYRELRRYNLARPDAPLYVIHGVWIPEERFLATQDLWDPRVVAEMDDLVDEVHRAVSGRLQRPERRGMAHGRWTADISRWVVAWSPGVEWDPQATHASEQRNPPRRFDGRYIRTRGTATSTEAWIARALDRLARRDAQAGWSRAMTFTNWLTADPLRHPSEPSEQEDLISVDATHLRATKAWPGGFFASYHAYPYYPDFLRFEYADARDPYEAYLRRLRAHHRGQAVMITEYGVPSSLGNAHLGPLGRDQGDHSEQEAAAIDRDLLRGIKRSGMAGGVLFEWVDEWFKLTWNTTDEEQPGERRAMWRNPLTNEEHFGVLAAEPGARAKVRVDGDDREWKVGQSQVLLEARGPLRELRATHDEAYLHLRLRFDGDDDRQRFVLGLDVRPGENRALPGTGGAMPAADVALRFDGDTVRLYKAAWTDVLAFQYGVARDYLDVDAATLEPGSGAWREPQMILNRPYTVPSTGERRPVELYPLSPVRVGDEARDERTLVGLRGPVVELRLPWALLGLADPSSRRVTVPREDGTVGTDVLPAGARIGIEAFDAAGASLGAASPGYGWEPWQRVTWHERRKAGWGTLRDAFAASVR
jgi:hypothetical protein